MGLNYLVWEALTDERGKKSHLETGVVVKKYLSSNLPFERVPSPCNMWRESSWELLPMVTLQKN